MAFLKKKKAMTEVRFSDVIALIRKLLGPVVESIINGTVFRSLWDANELEWK